MNEKHKIKYDDAHETEHGSHKNDTLDYGPIQM